LSAGRGCSGNRFFRQGDGGMWKIGRVFTVVRHVLVTGRLVPSSIAFVLTLACLVSARREFSLHLMASALPIMFATMSSFMMNDLWDRSKDVRSGRHRPLARGLISPATVAVGLCLSIIIALLLGWWTCGISSLYVLVAIIVGAILYSPLASTIPVLKNLYAAGLCCAPMVFANAVVGRALISDGLVPILLFVSGRELLLDVMDLDGDVASGQRTIPFYLHRCPSAMVGWILMAVGTVLLLLLPAPLPSRVLRMAAATSLGWALLSGTRSRRTCRRLRLAMVLGSIGVGIR